MRPEDEDPDYGRRSRERLQRFLFYFELITFPYVMANISPEL